MIDGVGVVAGKAGRREWLGLAVLALPTLLISIDSSVLYVALPRLSADLRPSGTQLLWITDIYGLMIAGFLVTMGGLGDRIGRRRLLMIGAMAFAIASALGAYAVNAEMLIASRALLGIAGATLMPSTLALLRTMFTDAKQLGMAIGVWVAVLAVGDGVAPVVGGVLLEWFWWGSVFLIGVPVMGLLLVLAPVLLPEYRGPATGKLDLLSAAMSLATILPIIWGLKELAAYGFAAVPLLAVAAGIGCGVLFVRRQRVLADPLVDLKLFRHRSFTTALTVMVLGLVTIGGTYLFVTQYMQMVLGLSALLAGLWLLPAASTDAVTSLLAPLLSRRIGPGYVVAAGLGFAALGYLLLACARPDSGIVLPLLGLVVVNAGLGPLIALSTDLIVGCSPPETAGSASSLSETGSELGLALGVATLGTLGTVVYRDQIAAAMPGGISGDDAVAAEQNIAEAISVSQHQPPPLGTELFDAATTAFTDGLTIVSLVSAGIAAVLAIVTAIVLRNIGRDTE